MAETVGTAIVRVIADGRGLDADIERDLRKTRPVFAKAGQEASDEFTKSFGDRFQQAMKKFDPKLPIAEQISKGIRELTGEVDDLDTSTDRTTGRWRIFRTELSKMRTSWKDGKEDAEKFGTAVEKIFGGKNPRNNFLNIVGNVVKAVATLAKRFTNLVSPIGRAMTGLVTGSEQVGTFGKLAGTAAAGVFLLGSALAALAIVAGPLAALLSGLVGIVGALASVLAFGLAGAAFAAAGALGGIAVAAGVVMLAVKNLSNEQKKALQPISDAFKDLGKTAADTFGGALVRNAGRITDIIKALDPLVKAVGRSLGRMLTGFTKALDGKEFQDFIKVMSKQLPPIIEQLATAFANIGLGLGQTFKASLPLVQQFASWLAGITGEFAEWASTSAGQKKLSDFFKRAGDAAAKLGDLLIAAGEALATIFDAGEESGTNLLDSITGALQKFIKWAQSDEGQKSMQDFFAFAQDAADWLGKALVAALELWDALDSPTGRKTLQLILLLVTKVTEGLATSLTLMEKIGGFVAIGGIMASFGKIGVVSGKIATAIDRIGDAFTDVKKRLSGVDFGDMWNKFAEGPKRAVNSVKGLAGRIKRAVGKVDLKDIFTLVPGGWLAAHFQGAWRSILHAIGKVDLKDIFDIPGVSWIAGKFTGLVRAILGAVGKVDLKDIFNIPSMSDIAGKFSGLDEAIQSAIGTVSIDIVGNPVGRFAGAVGGLFHAAGGIFAQPHLGIVGEAGPEAVVPLNRPLSLVDPAVRELSAIAQGMRSTRSTAQKIVEVGGISIITPTRDPRAVATEVVNHLVASGY